MILRLILFLALNFGALAIGGLFTGDGVPSEWYQTLNKAPWTPPGWVFGAAWTSIMICLSIYMAVAWGKLQDRSKLLLFYSIQWVLNVIWNPLFFYFHWVVTALVVIVLLTILIGWWWGQLRKQLPAISWLLAPYFVWLCIATSLNAYIWVAN